MVEYDRFGDGKLIVNHKMGAEIWRMLNESDFINFGPDPPVLLVAETTYSLQKEGGSNYEFLFTRVADEEYNKAEEWTGMSNRFTVNEDVGYISHFFNKPGDNRIGKSQFTSQVYTNSGAMLTFDIKQSLGEKATAFIRFPVDRRFSDEVKVGPFPGDFDYFHYQYRSFSEQFGDPPAAYDEYFHPHYSSKEIESGSEVVYMFEKMLPYVEKSERVWGGL